MKDNFYLFVIMLIGWWPLQPAKAQDVAGYWLGVTYPTDPNQAVYNYTMNLTVTGGKLGGTAQTANPNVPFGGMAYLSGSVGNNKVTFVEANQKGNQNDNNICYWKGTLTYDPVEESLKGSYENIYNPPYCNEQGGGKVELYRIVLKTGKTYCKGSPVSIRVTGKDIRWYDSAGKTKLLARGNTFEPNITQTTTFYITQTLYQNESPTVPITIEIVDFSVSANASDASCSGAGADGKIVATAPGQADVQYSLNNGSLQSSGTFEKLPEGHYTIHAQTLSGCKAERTVDIAKRLPPAIQSLQATSPRCGLANGTISVSATGGSGSYTFSYDGKTYQQGAQLSGLTAGSYVVRVRDANNCEATQPITLTALQSNPPVLRVINLNPATCNAANGKITLEPEGGTAPLTYSLDGTTFQDSPVFANLKGNSYTFTVRDANQCTVSSTVRLPNIPPPTLSVSSQTPPDCDAANGSIGVSSASGVQFSLNGSPFQASGTFANLAPGQYVITGIDGENCTATVAVSLAADCGQQVYIPTAFSPNGDQLNDGLALRFRFASLQIRRFTIFNRWGEVVYHRANFAVSSGESFWDGLHQQQPVPAGTYACLIDCQMPDQSTHVFRQPLTILK